MPRAGGFLCGKIPGGVRCRGEQHRDQGNGRNLLKTSRERYEVSHKRTHLVRCMKKVRTQRHAGTSAPLEGREESHPPSVIRKPALSIEVPCNGPVVLHRAALNDQPCVPPFVLQAQVQQRPGRQGREDHAAATENGLVMVDVGREWRRQKHVYGGGHFDLHTHCRRERDIRVQVGLHVGRQSQRGIAQGCVVWAAVSAASGGPLLRCSRQIRYRPLAMTIPPPMYTRLVGNTPHTTRSTRMPHSSAVYSKGATTEGGAFRNA